MVEASLETPKSAALDLKIIVRRKRKHLKTFAALAYLHSAAEPPSFQHLFNIGCRMKIRQSISSLKRCGKGRHRLLQGSHDLLETLHPPVEGLGATYYTRLALIKP